eukprot:264189_1
MIQFKLISACTILALFVIAFFLLIAIISHLVYVMFKEKATICRVLLSSTICSIVSFATSAVLFICGILHVILIEIHASHAHHHYHWVDSFYYKSFANMQYFANIFDTFGRLGVVFVFIFRYQSTFSEGAYSVPLAFLSGLYAVLFVLFMSSAAILALIAFDYDIHTIIAAECIWGLAVELMCLWLLYLFISKLYNLLATIVSARVDADCDQRFDSAEFITAFSKNVIDRSISDIRTTCGAKIDTKIMWKNAECSKYFSDSDLKKVKKSTSQAKQRKSRFTKPIRRSIQKKRKSANHMYNPAKRIRNANLTSSETVFS